MNQFILALLGVASAQNAQWPLYTTGTMPAYATFGQGGGYGCLRAGYTWVPQSTVTVSGTKTAGTTVGARWFRTADFTSTQATGTAALDTDQQVCCPAFDYTTTTGEVIDAASAGNYGDKADALACVPLTQDDSGNTQVLITSGIDYFNIGNGSGYSSGADSAEWLLAATWQPAYDSAVERTDANYCDSQITVLGADTMMEKDIITKGSNFTFATKCTYVIAVPAADEKAPAFSLTSSVTGGANFDGFTINYWDYLEASTMSSVGAGALYPATGTFPSDLTLAAYDAVSPGHIGCSMSSLKTPLDAWFTPTVSNSATNCVLIRKARNQYLKYVDDYSVIVEAYEADKVIYEAALRQEIDRLADFFTNLFDEKIAVPAKPMQPTPPGAYAGGYIAYDQTAYTAATTGDDATTQPVALNGYASLTT